jgi:hypothetical protein
MNVFGLWLGLMNSHRSVILPNEKAFALNGDLNKMCEPKREAGLKPLPTFSH